MFLPGIYLENFVLSISVYAVGQAKRVYSTL